MTRKNKFQLNHWNVLLNTECTVYRIGKKYLYPIFKNATNSLHQVCDEVLHNHEIKQCDEIDVLIRDPADRFETGLNTYLRINPKLKINDAISLIKEGKLMDRHFSPQWIWLLHLRVFYNGKVRLRSLEHISDYCNVHLNKSNGKIKVEVPFEFVSTDLLLMKYFEQAVSLDKIVKECKNALSKT